jgi:exosortase
MIIYKHLLRQDSVKAVILVSGRDFGRCPLASQLPTALWPVMNESALQRLLRHLSSQGISKATVCSNGDASLLAGCVTTTGSMELKFLDEQLPAGTAGCLRDAAAGDGDSLFVVCCAAIVSLPDINFLVREHQNSGREFTVALETVFEDGQHNNVPADIYVCDHKILEYIPKDGYYDIKESLIPGLLAEGKTVNTVVLPESTGSFRNRAGYLAAVGNYLHKSAEKNIGFHCRKLDGSRNLWQAGNARIDKSARLYGPVVMMDGAWVGENSIVFGPAVIGPGVTVGPNSYIENSVFWDNSSVGQNCTVRNCLVDYGGTVRDSVVVEDCSVVNGQSCKIASRANRLLSLAGQGISHLRSTATALLERVNVKPDDITSLGRAKSRVLSVLSLAALMIVFFWCYSSGLAELWSIWNKSDEYSCGLLVPLLAIYILWSKRRRISRCRLRPSVLGFFALLGAQAMRYFGLFFMYGSAERLSIVASLAALVLFLFGWRLFRSVFTTLLFLGLMLPLPRSIHGAIVLPLQSWATSSAVFCLQVFGYDVIKEGNIIHLGDTTVAVAEACNGLRMVTAFFVIIGLVVLIVDRKWWEKLIVLLSALPIALFCNTVRLTVTAVVYAALKGSNLDRLFHDFGGYAMIPIALALSVFELWILKKLTTEPKTLESRVVVTKYRAKT